jgi:hypothetical protein
VEASGGRSAEAVRVGVGVTVAGVAAVDVGSIGVAEAFAVGVGASHAGLHVTRSVRVRYQAPSPATRRSIA